MVTGIPATGRGTHTVNREHRRVAYTLGAIAPTLAGSAADMEKVIRLHLEPVVAGHERDRNLVIQKVASRVSADTDVVECALLEAKLIGPRIDIDRVVDVYMKQADALLAILRPHHLKLANSRFRTGRDTCRSDWVWLRPAIQAELGIEVLREESDGPGDETPCQHIVFGGWIDADTKQRLTREAEARESEEEVRRAREHLEGAVRAVADAEAKRARICAGCS